MICLEIQNVVYCYFSSVFLIEQKHCFQPVQLHSGWKLWSGVEMTKVKGQLTEWWRWGGDAVSVRRLNPSSMTPDQKQLMCLQSRAAFKWLCVAVKNMWSILWVVICWLWRILWGGSQILRVSWHDEGAVGNGLLDYGIKYFGSVMLRHEICFWMVLKLLKFCVYFFSSDVRFCSCTYTTQLNWILI